MGLANDTPAVLAAFERWADEVYDLRREDDEYVDKDTREAYREWREGWGKAVEDGG